MTLARLSLILLLGLCACSERSSAPYKNPWDRAAVQLGYAGWFYQPCYRKKTDAFGDVYVFIGSEECFRFNPPERMRGVWLDEGEDAEFLPNAVAAPVVRTWSPDGTALEFARSEPLLSGRQQYWAIEFVGRRATYPGHYGHLGMRRHLIIADEVLSATPVPPPQRWE